MVQLVQQRLLTKIQKVVHSTRQDVSDGLQYTFRIPKNHAPIPANGEPGQAGKGKSSFLPCSLARLPQEGVCLFTSKYPDLRCVPQPKVIWI